MLAQWIKSGAGSPITRAGKRQAVRAHKDELMVSLPRAWTRSTGLRARDRVTVSYSDEALIIQPAKHYTGV
jgi:hypothetical protein